MNIPKDKILYDTIKQKINKTQKPSAYRSGNIVRTYKKQFAEKYGNQSPYIGNKTKKKDFQDGSKKNGKTKEEKSGIHQNQIFIDQQKGLHIKHQ